MPARVRRAAVVSLTLAGGALCAGCAVQTAHRSGSTVVVVSTSSTRPPVRVLDHRTLDAGQEGTVRSADQHALLRIAVARPGVSRNRLSASYGHPPARGRYVSFHVRLTNGGQVPIDVTPLDFFVRSPSLRHTTTEDGNSPYSGDSQQLDATELAPRQQVGSDLTFDVRHPTGVLFYAPHGDVALAWRF